MRINVLNFVWLGLLLFAAQGGHAGWEGEDSEVPEYQVKAGFLFNFAKFVEWPAGSSRPDAPITIGILGKSPIGPELARIIRDRTVNGRKVEMKSGSSPLDLAQCNVVFVGRGQEKGLAEILKGFKASHALTVGDSNGFTEAGGMINFFIEDRKVRFEINDGTARKAGLTISSKLLSLAKKAG